MTFIYFLGINTFPGGNVHNNKFYLFDFGEQKIEWYGFTPTTPPNTNTIPEKSTGATSSNTEVSPQSPSLSKTVIIVLYTIGSMIGTCLLSAIIFFIYKYYKKRENKQ